jgi:hypothetical protein
MRKVNFYKWEKDKSGTYEKVFDGYGLLHQFSTDYKELEYGVGNYATAIIEMHDGTIRNIPVELVVFNN